MGIPCLSIVSLYGAFLRRCLATAGLSSHSLEIDSGTTIFFWGPTASTKPPLILIHGFGPHGIWQWRPQITFFAREFDVYVPDLIFFGNSYSNSPERSEVFQAVCIAKLLEKLGIRRYSVVGTSYGGFVAYRMSEMWPERVDKVVIASSGVNLRRGDNVELMKRAHTENIEDLMLPCAAGQLRILLGMCVFRRPYLPDFFLNDIINKLYSENRKEKLELLRGLRLGQDDTVNISPLSQEVLIVWGEHDKIFLLEKAIELSKYGLFNYYLIITTLSRRFIHMHGYGKFKNWCKIRLLGEKTRLQVIKDASHVPQLENAGRFNSIVKNFLHGML